MEGHSLPGTVSGDSGESIVQSGGDDKAENCACTDAAILSNYLSNFNIIAPKTILKTDIVMMLER